MRWKFFIVRRKLCTLNAHHKETEVCSAYEIFSLGLNGAEETVLYDRDPRDKLWRVLQEYCIDGYLLMASHFTVSLKFVFAIKVIYVAVGLQLACVLSPLLFTIYMNWIDKLSRTNECLQQEDARLFGCFSQMIYFVLLAFSESGLQHALNGFAAACDIVGMKSALTKLRYCIFREILFNDLCKLTVYRWSWWRNSKIMR